MMAVNIKITYQPEKGVKQTLWSEVEDWDKLRELQAYTTRTDAGDIVIPLYASLTPGGLIGPRFLRADRTTIEEAP